MNPCKGLPADQYLEDYLLGTLPEAEAVAFEEHYFDCPVCLGRLEALQAAQKQLRTMPTGPKRTVLAWPARFVAIGAIAAALIAVAFVYQSHRQSQENAQANNAGPAAHSGSDAPADGKSAPAQPTLVARTVSNLADLSLPAFRVPNLRGPGGDPLFEQGMKFYAAQDCPNASKSLAQISAASDFAIAAHFYSGVCSMHEGDYAEASSALRKVADAGDSPQQEAALYYLAQVDLAQNDAGAARKDLEQTIALRGDFEKRAREQLAKLSAEASPQ